MRPRLLRPRGPRHARRERVPRRGGRWGVLAVAALFALVGLGAGAVTASRIAVSSVAQAKILVPPLTGNAYTQRVGDTFPDLKTEAQVPMSDAVLSRAAPADAGAKGVQDLRRRVYSRVVDNAEVVVITAGAPTPDAAVALARNVAEATLDERLARAKEMLAGRAAMLEVHVDEAEAELREARSGSAAEVTSLSRRLTALRAELRSVQGARPDAGALISTTPGSEPRRKMRIAIVALGALAGAGVGAVVAHRAGFRWRPRPRAGGRVAAAAPLLAGAGAR